MGSLDLRGGVVVSNLISWEDGGYRFCLRFRRYWARSLKLILENNRYVKLINWPEKSREFHAVDVISASVIVIDLTPARLSETDTRALWACLTVTTSCGSPKSRDFVVSLTCVVTIRESIIKTEIERSTTFLTWLKGWGFRVKTIITLTIVWGALKRDIIAPLINWES